MKNRFFMSFMKTVKEPEPLTKTSDLRRFLDEFSDPPAAFRGKPFWSWNGDLDEEELLRQLDILKAMGMGGTFMHSRTGLKTTYLGEKWFQLVNRCAERSEELGMEGWLYDEDRWPSGTAGGMVTKDPKYRMRSILLSTFGSGEKVEWPARENFLEAHLADLDGLDLKGYDPLEYGQLEICPPDRTVLVFTREIHAGHSFYNGGAYLDTLNRDATERFIEMTHERYAGKCGQHFGKAIRGIFTDEPHRGLIMCDTASQPGAQRPSHAVPYTDRLFEEFFNRFGYELRGRLPEIYYRFDGKRLSPLKWHYVELLEQMFLENWARPCREWCERHGLILTGHILHEDSLGAQVIPCGSILRYYEEMDYPGIDILARDNRAYWVAKQVVSVARQLGKPFVMSELYGCTGWQTDFSDHKQFGDWQAFLGVNIRCHHLCWYSMAGESKRDYPASIFYQSAWYKEYKYVEDYFSRINYLLKKGQPDCDILVVHPVESLWAQIYLGWATWLQSTAPEVQQLEEKFTTLFHWFLDAQLDFDYGDEEQMGRLAQVEDGGEDGPFLRFGEMKYRTIVVGGMETMRESTLELLQSFAAAGGAVVFAGDPPTAINAEVGNRVLPLLRESTHVNWSGPEVVQAARTSSRQRLSVNKGCGQAGLISQVRCLENGEVLLGLVNTTRESIDKVHLGLRSRGKVEKLDCREPGIETVPAEAQGDLLLWTTSFAPLEEKIFRVSEVPLGSTDVEHEMDGEPEDSLELGGPFGYSLSEPNALVLDTARYRLDDGEWSEPTEVVRIDSEIRNRLGWTQRSGQMVQPWAADESKPSGYTIELEFDFQVDKLPSELDLLLEQPERWEVCLNDRPLDLSGEAPWFIDIALKRLSLPVSVLREGRNQLRLSAVLQEDTDIEAVYLLGPFGVWRDPEGSFRIGELPDSLILGDLTTQGSPFYTGRVRYDIPLPEAWHGQRVRLQLPSFSGACASLDQEDGKSVLGFPPFVGNTTVLQAQASLAVEIILTRQNLFGPLHRIPLIELFTSPESFRKTGEAFSDEPQLYPSGLLQAPRFWLLPERTQESGKGSTRGRGLQ